MTQNTRTLVLIGLLCLVFIGAGYFLAFANGGSNPLLPAVQSVVSTTTYTVVPVATSTSTTVVTKPAPTPTPKPVPTPAPAPSSTTMITPTDNGTTVTYKQGDRFGIAMGDSLQWDLEFDPTGIVTRVPNISTLRGEQGVYTATTKGTTVLHASGRPVCNPGMMCPQFIQEVTVTIKVI